MPVEDGRFDRVLLNQVLEHVADPPAVLAELYRVLKLPPGPAGPGRAVGAGSSTICHHPPRE
ncbi:MAG: class I SAM-dependent methyltransferase [Haloechinothrix sp.]